MAEAERRAGAPEHGQGLDVARDLFWGTADLGKVAQNGALEHLAQWRLRQKVRPWQAEVRVSADAAAEQVRGRGRGEATPRGKRSGTSWRLPRWAWRPRSTRGAGGEAAELWSGHVQSLFEDALGGAAQFSHGQKAARRPIQADDLRGHSR